MNPPREYGNYSQQLVGADRLSHRLDNKQLEIVTVKAGLKITRIETT
jgi:hypothetical protein